MSNVFVLLLLKHYSLFFLQIVLFPSIISSLCFFLYFSYVLYGLCVCVCVCKFFFRFFILFCELRREYWWMHKLEQRTKNKSVRVVVDGSLVSSFCKHILIKHRTYYWNDSGNDDDDDDNDSDSGNNATTADRMLFVALRCSCAVVFISFEWDSRRPNEKFCTLSLSLSRSLLSRIIKRFTNTLGRRTHKHGSARGNIQFSFSSVARPLVLVLACSSFHSPVGPACEKLTCILKASRSLAHSLHLRLMWMCMGVRLAKNK